ncbi:MAG TPA: bifunctional phosphoribosylaminoimidazolecarboxamide formyltransferase/IMP cyclohydrolase, partial [Chloroflexota bacterium]|nr:bifunctional phosphoribosylaminoimidazolecarboxamide formyltransferase/IMP cyclohydrolase [Chloroflexota bacterium]
DKAEHMDQLAQHGISAIDIVVCNLYPFASDPSIELIDIGGVALLRAAAKNHESVVVVSDPADYDLVLAELRLHHEVSEPSRRTLAGQAFELTASYDALIAGWFKQTLFPARMPLGLTKSLDLRYGENPHQQAAFYALPGEDPAFPALSNLRQLGGKELSFNNLLDMEAAVGAATAFEEPCVAIIKHNNPCGLAIRDELAEAYRQALAGDPVSAYGSVIACNRIVDAATAEAMADLFIEVLAAPAFDPKALELLAAKKNRRLIEMPGDWQCQPSPYGNLDFKRVRGGFLVQTLDFDTQNLGFQVAGKQQPTAGQIEDLEFAWKVVRHVKSNAIVLARDRMLLGVGAGQMSRVESVDIAAGKAADRAKGSVLASDAFFPFADGVEHAIAAGVAAIIQPGGSTHDPEVVAAADEAGIPMVFTGERHFKH